MTKSLLKRLNQAQREAVTFGEGPVLILAGAGSGKTRALTYRVAYLIKEKEIGPERILLVTFTNKAAREMKERVKELVGNKLSLPFAGTFHALAAKLLRIEGKRIGVAEDYVIYDEDDALEVIKQAMKNLGIEEKSFKPRAVKAAISGAKNELVTAEEYGSYRGSHWQETVGKVYLEYQRLLKKYEALDFDDLLMEAVRLLQRDKEVREKYQQKFYYVLVDEYQDTNKAQYMMTKLLASKWRNLCVVGDASQSIYSWRGADYRNLNNLEKDFPDLKIINLEQNYRSTKNILEAAYQVINKNSGHPILKLWTEAEKGEKIGIMEAENEKEEVGWIVKEIKKEPRDYGEIAVLYRTNAQSRIVEEALIRAGIPYALVGGIRFYGRREIKDCLAYLRYLINSKDTVSYQRLEKLGKRRLEKFLEWAEEFKKRKEELSSREILEEIMEVTGYLERYDEKNEEEAMRLENIKELNSVAEEFKDLREFLENVALVEQTDFDSGKDKKGEGKVTLMTLHASKGLEFKTIFMIGMEEGLFPHSRSMLDKQELEEERRLCYVGMTRAKKKLWLSYARRRLFFGSRTSNSVSRFLSDLDERLIEKVGEKEREIERMMEEVDRKMEREIVADWEQVDDDFDKIIKIDDY